MRIVLHIVGIFCFLMIGTTVSGQENSKKNKKAAFNISKQRNCKDEVLLDRFTKVYKVVSNDVKNIETISRGAVNSHIFAKNIATLEYLGKRIDKTVKKSRIPELKSLYPFSRLIKQMKRRIMRMDSVSGATVVSFKISAPLKLMSYNKEVSYYKVADWIILQQIATLKTFTFPALKSPFKSKRERLLFTINNFLETRDAFVGDYTTETLVDYISVKSNETFTSLSSEYGGEANHVCRERCLKNHLYVRELRKEGVVVKARGTQTIVKDGDDQIPGSFYPKIVKAWYKAPSGKLYSSGVLNPDKKRFDNNILNYMRMQLTAVRSKMLRSRVGLESIDIDVEGLNNKIEELRTVLKKYKNFSTEEKSLAVFNNACTALENIVSVLQS